MSEYKSYFRKINDYEIYFCEDCIHYNQGLCEVYKNKLILKHFTKKVKPNHHICNDFKKGGDLIGYKR